jgi:hypothetical protein
VEGCSDARVGRPGASGSSELRGEALAAIGAVFGELRAETRGARGQQALEVGLGRPARSDGRGRLEGLACEDGRGRRGSCSSGRWWARGPAGAAPRSGGSWASGQRVGCGLLRAGGSWWWAARRGLLSVHAVVQGQGGLGHAAMGRALLASAGGGAEQGFAGGRTLGPVRLRPGAAEVRAAVVLVDVDRMGMNSTARRTAENWPRKCSDLGGN